MKSISKIIIALLIIVSLTGSCKKDTISSSTPSDFLIGHWNSYEMGTQQTGFTKIVTTSLTIAYESGLAFSKDGTFKVRHYDESNGKWSEDDVVIGTFELKSNSIALTYFPKTKDEFKLDLQLVKLDEKHLWFRHNYFGPEIEHHLEKSN
jgi:hypothetical protein